MKDEELFQFVRQALDRRLDDLSMPDAARLSAARHRALDRSYRGSRWRPLAGWAVAATVVVAVSLWWHQAPVHNGLGAMDFELLVSGEGIELYEELEFYEWFSSEDGTG